MIRTTPKYWDCECKDMYIRSATQSACGACGAVREEQPDSRVEEVVVDLQKELSILDEVIDKVECFGVRDVVRRQQILNVLASFK